jgi:hypothetical protein
MAEHIPTDAQNLTGVWNGLFTHPDHEPVSFVATLIDTGAMLSGSTHDEKCMMRGCPRRTHNAILDGRRNGSAVSFTKTYDPPGFGYDAVVYDGALNADATEIDGQWSIPAFFLSGKFLMIRSNSLTRQRSKAARERV